MAPAAFLSLPASARLDGPFDQQQFRSINRPTPLIFDYALHKSQAAVASSGGALVSPVTPRSLSISASSIAYPTFRGAASPVTPRRHRGSSGVDHRDACRRIAVDYDGQSPLLSARPVPTTPLSARRFSMPSQLEQDIFEALCRRRFYEASVEAAAEIDRILRDSAASHTAQTCYNRILSSIRAQYHDNVAKQKRRTLDTALREASPNSFLTAAERKLAVKQFLADYVSREMIGTHPFAKALYMLLRIQAVKSAKGGAGGSCLQWSIEDDVFMEAGPAQWTRDSVQLLKSTLGLLDLAGPDGAGQSHYSADESDAIVDNTSVLFAQSSPDASTQNPFADQDQQRRDSARTSRKVAGAMGSGLKRTFRVPPTYRDAELEDLIAVFPAWIATPSVVTSRFLNSGALDKIEQPASPSVLEGGLIFDNAKAPPSQTIKAPTGIIDISTIPRLPGYQSSVMDKLRGWLRRVLGLPC